MKVGQIRIIAGKWRGRKLTVLEGTGLRPTPERVRETVFNWLAPVMAGARCLDLFAGSGALGFEALSRGAALVVMVDQAQPVVALLQKELLAFGAENALVYRAKVPEQLREAAHPFDVVFLDPPYQANLLFACCDYLEAGGFLAAGAYIYLEAAEPIDNALLPAHWRILKSHRAGQVAYHLAQRGYST